MNNLRIKYINKNEANEVGFDLSLLGESFIGLNELFKEYFEITGIHGELTIRAEKIIDGSIDIYSIIQIIDYAPFQDATQLLDFLQVTSPDLFAQVTHFFNNFDFGSIHKSVNDYFTAHPLDLTIVNTLLTIYLTKMLTAGGKVKNGQPDDVNGKAFPERYTSKLRQMIQRGKYKKVLKPMIEGNVSAIQLKTDNGDTATSTEITESHLESYLPEDEKILPDFNNGDIKRLTGEIRALQSVKGERLKIKINDVDPQYQLLTARPADGQNTEDYKEYYKKPVNIEAEVYRASMYKRPELIIRTIEKAQGVLFDQINDKTIE